MTVAFRSTLHQLQEDLKLRTQMLKSLEPFAETLLSLGLDPASNIAQPRFPGGKMAKHGKKVKVKKPKPKPKKKKK